MPCVKRLSTEPSLAQSSKSTTDILNHIILFFPLPKIIPRGTQNKLFFILITPSGITTFNFSKSADVRFLIVYSGLKYFPVNQYVVESSIYFHEFTFTAPPIDGS